MHTTSDDVVAKVLREYQNPAYKTADIARHHKISAATVTLWARQAGLKLRSRGRTSRDVPSAHQLNIMAVARTLGTGEAVRRFGVRKQHVSRLFRRWREWEASNKPPFERGDMVHRDGETVTVLVARIEDGAVVMPDRTVNQSWPWSRRGVMAKKVGVSTLFAGSAAQT